jgi:uncharacterized membrane protein YhaH (DUF805 family)
MPGNQWAVVGRICGKEAAMKGNVIGFDPETNTGVISGDDGQRYDFVTNDLLVLEKSGRGDLVEFMPDGGHATKIFVVEPAWVPPSFARFYFSPSGRISRSQYWLRSVLPLLVGVVTLRLAAFAHGETRAEPGVFLLLLNLFYLASLWPGTATLVKRIHDRNKSGWLVLIFYIPFVLGLIVAAVALANIAEHNIHIGNQWANFGAVLFAVVGAVGIWFFIDFGCLRGTIGVNRYGPDPTPRR